MSTRLRRVLRVARWEAARASGGVDRRTLLAAVALFAVAGGVLGAGLAAGVVGLDVDRDVYRVGVDDGSPYADAVEAESALTLVSAERASLGTTADLIVHDDGSGGGIVAVAADTRKGEAAAAEFREAVEAHNERLMAAETNETAAFPLSVTLRYVTRGGSLPDTSLGGTGDEVGTDDGSADGDEADGDAGGSGDGSTDGSDGGIGDVDDGGDGAGGNGEDDALAVPSVGGGLGGGAFGGDSVGAPGSITPPFPFASLLLAFVFLVPMNFIVQAYGSSVLDERTNRRGEPLLVTPLAPVDIVAGKTLPYVAVAVGITALIAGLVGGGVVSVLAILPIAATFLAATFVGAVFARSFKELTFVTVAVSVLLTSYAFVPAIFTNVTPVALISPLTLVVFDLQGEAVSLGEFLFATTPTALASVLLFGLGLGVYREEDLFTQKPVGRKFLDALAARLYAVGEGVRRPPATGIAARVPERLRGVGAVAFLTACTVPFVFVAELLAVAVLFALPVSVSIPVLLVTIAFIEEVAKSVHLYAGFERGVFARTDRVALAVGLASGLGFFVAEKATAVVQAIGLTELYVGRAAFGSVAGVAGLSPALLVALFLAPLVVHGFTTAVTAVGASRNRTYYAGTLVVATLLHAAYNVGVLGIHG